jgi:hypothetical protein
MKDFAGSRSTYYSLAREKLRGKHPKVFNILLVLVLIAMTGLAAFLLSDIISFGLNSDHKSVLAGFEDQDPVKSIMSIINWNEKNLKPAVLDNPVVQKGGLIGLSVANSSPRMSDTGRLEANISGKKNSSLFQMDGSSQKAKERKPSNSSPMPNSFSSNQVSSDSAVRNTASGTISNKLIKEKVTTTSKLKRQGSSRETPISQSLKQKDIQQDLNYSINTQMNSSQANITQANSSQANITQANSTQANSTQLSNIRADNTSIDQLQTKETSTINSTIDETSISQPQTNPSPPKNSQIVLSQLNAAEAYSLQLNQSSNKPQLSETRTIEEPAVKESAVKEPAVKEPAVKEPAVKEPAVKEPAVKEPAVKEPAVKELAIKEPAIKELAEEEIKTGNGLSENGNKKTSRGNSPANPVASHTTEAKNIEKKTALTKSAADIRADSPDDPAKDVSAKNTLEIKFKTDSTISPKSENSQGGDHAGGGAVSGANAPSSPITSKSSPAQYKKNDAKKSEDLTSISKSPATGKESGSGRKQKPAMTGKIQKAQEIRYQKIANKNRLAENAKKKAALARERTR